jgi:hypothetical protein
MSFFSFFELAGFYLKLLNFCISASPFSCFLQIGVSHADILRSLLCHACTRYPTIPLPKSIGISIATSNSNSKAEFEMGGPPTKRQKVFVLFGGDSSERQVSLISGTNVWLNLRGCSDVNFLTQLFSMFHVGYVHFDYMRYAYIWRTWLQLLHLCH